MKNEINNMKQLQDVYLTQDKFEKDLKECLTIINYPSKKKSYYVCEHISPALHKRKVNVYITN